MIILFVISDITNILNEIPNEDELFDLLHAIRGKWYDIGVALKISFNVLVCLKQKNYTDNLRLLHIINIWVNTRPSPVNWGTLIAAIESHHVKNKTKADEILHYLQTGNSN